MTNQETQEGMLSHFQKIGVASHFVGMLGTPKKKKKKKNIAAIAAMTKKTHTHTHTCNVEQDTRHLRFLLSVA
jgi:hypothetical protein